MKKIFSHLILTYLRILARHQLRKNPRAIIVGITGSAGKTSTRLAVAKILSIRGIVKHSAHANSESGIPLNILGIHLSGYTPWHWFKALLLATYRALYWSEKYDYYVVEMGIDSPFPPKNMSYLLSILVPDIAVVLGAGLTHAAAFDPLVKDTSPTRRQAKLLAHIASHKMLLAKSLPPTATAIINGDSSVLRPHLKDIRAHQILFGTSPRVDLRYHSPQVSATGFKLKLSHKLATNTLKLPDPLGKEYGSTFAAAAAVGMALGIPLSRCCEALSTYRAPAGRLRYFPGQQNSHILDSSYNASPATMLEAIHTLKLCARTHSKLLVLGDMRELGSLSRQAHQDLARNLRTLSATYILFGPAMHNYVAPYLRRYHNRVYTPSTMIELIGILQKSLRPNLWVLVKGSQNQLLLERAVEAILADPNDVSQLARRGTYWERVRAETP